MQSLGAAKISEENKIIALKEQHHHILPRTQHWVKIPLLMSRINFLIIKWEVVTVFPAIFKQLLLSWLWFHILPSQEKEQHKNMPLPPPHQERGFTRKPIKSPEIGSSK